MDVQTTGCPTEVPMAKDIEIWKSNQLSEPERLLIMRNLGFFSTAESLVANNITLAIYKYVTNRVPSISLKASFRRSDPYPYLPLHRRVAHAGRG